MSPNQGRRPEDDAAFMSSVYVGRSGLKVGEIALGAWTFGREVGESDAFEILDLFVSRGGTLVDTAPGYNDGRSEEIIGRWMHARANRDQMVIATKVYGRAGHGRSTVGLSRPHLRASLEASLRRLGTDAVDLYQTHFWDPATPLEETLGAFNDLVRTGLVRYVGVSNFGGWHITKAAMLCLAHQWEPLVSIQPEYSLLAREPEWEVIPAARDAGLGVLPWSPLAGGWLTGKHKRGSNEPTAGTRVAESALPWQPDSWEQRNNEDTWRVLATVSDIAGAREKPMGQVALNWLRAKSNVTAPIVGARSVEQLEETLGCITWELSEVEFDELEGISALPLPRPHDLIEHVSREELWVNYRS